MIVYLSVSDRGCFSAIVKPLKLIESAGDAMMIGSAMNSGFASIQSGMKLMDSSAQTIARQAVASPDSGDRAAGEQPPGGASPISATGDVTRALIEQRQALYQVQAGARIIQTSDKALGSLLDTMV